MTPDVLVQLGRDRLGPRAPGKTGVHGRHGQSGQLPEQGWQVGEGVQDVVGYAVGGAVGAGQVLAGFDQDPGEPAPLGSQHVGFDVVAHHHGVRGVGAEVP